MPVFLLSPYPFSQIIHQSYIPHAPDSQAGHFSKFSKGLRFPCMAKSTRSILHCKKGYRFSRHQPARRHLPNSPWPGIIPRQGDFGKWHPGWGQENRYPFLQCSRHAGISPWTVIPKDSGPFKEQSLFPFYRIETLHFPLQDLVPLYPPGPCILVLCSPLSSTTTVHISPPVLSTHIFSGMFSDINTFERGGGEGHIFQCLLPGLSGR